MKTRVAMLPNITSQQIQPKAKKNPLISRFLYTTVPYSNIQEHVTENNY